MKIIGIKMTEDSASTKIMYIKDNKIYVRSGADDFTTGRPLQGSYTHLMDRFGYREVINPPIVNSAEEMANAVSKFQPKNRGRAQYTV